MRELLNIFNFVEKDKAKKAVVKIMRVIADFFRHSKGEK